MVPEGVGVLKLNPDPALRAATQRLETFSHLWVVFLFHKNGGSWHPIVDHPRVGEGSGVGAFATRSPHRPNPIGLSVVKLDRIDRDAPGGVEIHISGVDILDQSPLLDIKPYLPYADSHPQADAGWASNQIARYAVSFSAQARRFFDDTPTAHRHPRLESLIVQMLEWDPRPTSQRRSHPMEDPASESQTYAFRILGLDVHWCIQKGAPHVQAIRTLD
jgi:tRNA (adenine37-N6)-methyltransferase